ncbi:unnamed protein product, partial [Coregonus sp. 'balchen']
MARVNFGEKDRQAVEAICMWVANQSLVPAEHCVPLSAVQPKTYFDLTCQLLAKALWTQLHPAEGSPTLSKDRGNLTANILVYDNHVE